MLYVMARYSFSTQKLEFDHIANARDLGGYEMMDGRHIKRGLLLRGGRLSKATDADIKKLQNLYKLTHIFDFRTEEEISHAPDRMVPGTSYLWLPAIDPETDKLMGSSLPHEAYHDLPGFLSTNEVTEQIVKVAREMYPSLAHNEYSQLQYSSFLQMIAASKGGAVFWHCSQGKDRTGLGAAFLLAALGADRELIMEDFTISYEVYAREMEDTYSRMRENGMEVGPDQIEVVESFVGVSVDHFSTMLDEIDERYGSLQKYLNDILLIDASDCEKLRSNYLE